MVTRARAAIVIALVVICSALAGAALDRVAFLRMRRRPPFGQGGGGPGGPGGPGRGPGRGSREEDSRRRVEMLDRMTKDLSLTPAQRAGIDSVMQHTDSSLRAIRTEMQPRLTKVFEDSRTQILSRLDSTQRGKFDQMTPRRGRR
jgi:hypothetical protein